MEISNLRKYFRLPLLVLFFLYSALCWWRFGIGLSQTENGLSQRQGTEWAPYTALHFTDSLWTAWMYHRQNYIMYDASLAYELTGWLVQKNVVEGSNGWYYYMTSTDGNTIEDYEGKVFFHDHDKGVVLPMIARSQQKMAERGIRYIAVGVPNKSNVYWEPLQDVYAHADTSKMDDMIGFLHGHGINIYSAKRDLMAKRDQYQLYYKTDSHWNQLGAYVAVELVMRELGLKMPQLDDCGIDSVPLSTCRHSGAHMDLYYTSKLLRQEEENEYTVQGTTAMDWSAYDPEESRGLLSFFENPSASYDKTVLIIGDSYRTATLPAFRSLFSKVYVIHRNNYTASLLDETRPDYFVDIYVERYFGAITVSDRLVD